MIAEDLAFIAIVRRHHFGAEADRARPASGSISITLEALG